MGILADLKGARVYLDVNAFIYFLEDYAPFAGALRSLFAQMDAGQTVGVTSELTLAELLVKPLRDKNENAVLRYQEIISNRNGLEIQPISRQVLIEAARLRADRAMKLPDAIHVATARMAGCSAFLTNDAGIRSTADIVMVKISDIAAQEKQ